MFDRSAILRAAHAGARSKIANNRAWRSYREALAASMKQAWAAARREHLQRLVEAEDAAATIAIPADTARRISDLRIIAGAQAFTAFGNYRRRLILAEAEDIERAARCVMIPAPESHHHAH